MSRQEDIIREQAAENRTMFGFWTYLMTDCILFATLFATFAVLRNNTYGGPSGEELFSLSFVLLETLILLTSSFTAGLGVLAARRHLKKPAIVLFGITFTLGLAFLGLELNEFRQLATEGNSWRRSGFLSAFFTLVGTHGAHITAGLVWMGFLVAQVIRHGLNPISIRRLGLLGLFWHFLDIIWIFIFTFVYLAGGL